ncbi:MAG TPA: hypothetical protein PLL78_02645 [Fimbriimonadaceae bacterium]|nr:hypothetical protein [Fimbriimonadaceae bacterium]HRJ95558.1 hypothetical protein [Fimbriimonadaceae bacterium]
MTVSDLAKTQALLRALQAKSEPNVPERAKAPSIPAPQEERPSPPDVGGKGRFIDIRV